MDVDALETAAAIAEPLQVVGYSFYFDAVTRARAKELGLRGVEYYGLGRGGLLGDVDAARVAEVFAFFSDDAVEAFWSVPRSKADPTVVAEEYLRSAFDFADRTFGGVEEAVLVDFATAAQVVAGACAPGESPLLDGYRRFAVPAEPVRAAYLGAIELREMRGGLHVRSLARVGLEPASAAYLENPSIFSSHGYGDADVPVVTDELRAKKTRAEELTDEAMAACVAVLDEDAREALVEGATALFAALSDPVTVAR